MKERLATISELAARVFPREVVPNIERVHEGVSTEVYRLHVGGETYYMRVLPEEHASFAPEAYVHRLLRGQGAKVPEIVFFEHLNPMLQRSVMVTTEIKGVPIRGSPITSGLRRVLFDAGNDLAAINSLEVEGFGWIVRDSETVSRLRAELSSYREWMRDSLGDCLNMLERTRVLGAGEVEVIQEILHTMDSYFEVRQAYLVHGDFDGTHIYHQDGIYSGIIDFGEIRGADQLYDLGHFNVEQSEWLPYLLEGWGETGQLPPDHMQRIQLTSLLIALQRLGKQSLRKPGSVYEPYREAIRRASRLMMR